MARLTMTRLKQVFDTRLGLRDPLYLLEFAGGKISGSIVSASFAGKSDFARQNMLWDALDAELGPKSSLIVGTLLAYTPKEWNLDLEGMSRKRIKRAG